MKSVDVVVLVYAPGERERESKRVRARARSSQAWLFPKLFLPSGAEASLIRFDGSEDNFTALPPNPRSELSR